MNSILSYIAGFLVLLLFAALVGPGIVDWNSFRSEIESQISSATGRPVTVGGDINFVILPAPRFSLRELSVASADGGEPLAQIGTLEGEIALAPLLRGEVEVTRVRAVDFTLRLTRDENGKLNWTDDNGTGSAATIDPASISLDSALFEGGTLVYLDKASGQELTFGAIDGDLKATSLLGPFRFDGGFGFDGATYALAAGVGAFGGDRAFPVNLELSVPARNWQSSFSGIATEATAAARLDGVVRFQFGEQADVPEGQTTSLISLQAGAVVSRKQAVLRDIELTAAGSVLKGQAEIAFDAVPTLTAELSGARLLVDKLFGGLEAQGMPLTALRVPEGLAGSMEIKVADLGLGPLHASNAAGVLGFEQGSLAVRALSADFPGETRALVHGTVNFAQEAPRFDGTLEASVGKLPALTRWIHNNLSAEAPTEATPPASGGPTRLRLETELALQPSLWQAYSASLVFGDAQGDLAPMTGGVSLARHSRPALGLELEGPLLDLTPFAPFLPVADLSAGLDLSAFDASLVISAERFRLRDLSLNNFALTAALLDGRLSIETFSARTEDEKSISLSGSLADIGPFASGGIEGQADAALLAGMAQNVLGVPFVSAREGVLSFVLRGERAEAEHLLSLDLTGKADNSDASLVFKRVRPLAEDGPDQVDLVISLENPVAPDLAQQIGLGAVAPVPGAGVIRAQFSGPSEGPLDTNVRLRIGDAAVSATGSVRTPFESPHFTGRFESSADRFDTIAAATGWQGALADLIVANGRQGAFIAGGALDWSSDRVTLSELEAVAGTFRVSGSGSLSRSDGLVKIDADLDLGRLSLDRLFAVEEEGPWSARPLDWQALSGAQGSFQIAASTVELAGLEFDRVEATASLADGVLSFTPVTARFADGRLTMGGRFEGGAGVPGVGLTVALEEAAVADAGKMIFRAPLGEGRATASLQLEGRGRSLLGLVSTLAGRGTLVLGEGTLSGFDLTAFRAGLDGLEEMDGFEPLTAQTLLQGQSAFDAIEGPVRIEDGILSFTPETVQVAGATDMKIKVLADLVRLEMDAESVISLEGEKPLPPLTMVLSGGLRDLARRVDTISLQAAVSQALLVREMEEAGVESLPDELRDLIVPPVASGGLDVPLEGVLPVPPDAALETGSTGAPVPRVRP